MRYKYSHIERLRAEAHQRFERLLDCLPQHTGLQRPSIVEVDGTSIHLAVTDLKAILSEIRRLK